MRICYVVNINAGNYLAGGSNNSIINLLEADVHRGFDDVWMVCHKSCAVLDVAQEYGIRTAIVKGKTTTRSKRKLPFIIEIKSHFKWPYILLHIGDAVRFLKDNKIGLIHFNEVSCSPTLAYAALKLGIPYIWHIREFLDEDSGRWFAWEKESLRLIRSATEIIAISEAVRKKWEPLLGRTIRVVYNGLPKTQNYTERKYLLDKYEVRLALIGRIAEGKGQLEAVKAIECLKEQGYKNFRLTIVGYRGIDCYEKKLINYVKKHNLEHVIKIIDYTSELKKIRKTHDIGLTCSRAEAFGRVTIENMLSGMLVVGTNSGGTPELVRNGETGFLYEPGDTKGLMEILLRIERERENARLIAKYGQNYAMENFLIENTADQIHGLYQEIMDTPNRLGGDCPKTPRLDFDNRQRGIIQKRLLKTPPWLI